MTGEASPSAPAPAPADRRGLSAVLVAGAVLPWVPVVFAELRDGALPLALWNLLVMGVLLAAAAAAWRGGDGLRRLSGSAAWFGAAWAAIQALRGESSLLWLATGAAAAGALLQPVPPPARPPAPAAPAPPETFGVWLKENVEAIVVAFVMALVIRCFCIEVFKIPSSSMEPTLLGDVHDKHSRNECGFRDYHGHPSGDRIMVTKYYYAFAPVERFDVVVFKFPLSQSKNFIKRVVGLPDEELKIWRGDLYTRPRGAERFSIARKPLRTQESLWIDPLPGGAALLSSGEAFTRAFEARPAAPGARRAEFLVRDGVLETQESDGERGLRFSLGPSIRDLDSYASDLRLFLDVELTSPGGQAYLEVSGPRGRFELRLDSAGESQLRHHAPGAGDKPPTSIAPLQGWTFAPYARHKADLWVVDGMAYARIDGRVLAKLPFIEHREDASAPDSVPAGVAFGSRGATFLARGLRVGRDVHYSRSLGGGSFPMEEDMAVAIPPGEYLMMGDNVNNSHDSRVWVERTYRLKDGRSYVCEAQEVEEHYSALKDYAQRRGLETPPDLLIKADQRGNEVALFKKDLVLNETGVEEYRHRAYRTVHGRFIVGKALWIWFPWGRWFRLIR